LTRLAAFLVGLGGRWTRDAFPVGVRPNIFVLGLGCGHGAARVNAAPGDGRLDHDQLREKQKLRDAQLSAPTAVKLW
jgi:hypothetical protein